MTEEPTATQYVAVGQSTEPSAPNVVGKFGTVHVVPLFDDNRSSPAYGPFGLGETPTLTQRVVVGQVTPSKVVLLVGTDDDVQVNPPSLERTVEPCPTATQSAELAQSTAFNTGSLASRAPWLQVPPPFCEVETTPPRPPSPPTATHLVAVMHETALKLPLPLAAPPDVGTVGALVSPWGSNH
jgi:hypothetical protein